MGEPQLAERIASDLLSIGAVTFSPDKPYIFASGMKAPIYCDNRQTIGFPLIRNRIAEGFEVCLRRRGICPERIVGTATAGIPHAAFLANRVGLPMAYVRSKPKEHGRGNQIEGPMEAGDAVVVVEDLVSTGMSSVAVVETLRRTGIDVIAVLAIFSYGLTQSEKAFLEAGLPLVTLTDFPTMLRVAHREGILDPDAVSSLESWHRDPIQWSTAH